MYSIFCVFDHRQEPSKPLFAVSFNDQTNKIDLYQLYFKGVKHSLAKACQNDEKLKEIIENQTVLLSNFRAFIKHLKLDINAEYDVFDVDIDTTTSATSLAEVKKQALNGLLNLRKIKAEPWQKVLANSQLAYTFLERQGYFHNYRKKHSTYELAYTGRSRCLKNNIQGTNKEDVIEHIDDKNIVFVHFDWIAADFRIASIISKDEMLQSSFEESDPYSLLHKELNSDEISRDQCKLELFRSLYSINYKNATLEFYPKFAKWMKESSETITEKGWGESLLNRKFYTSNERDLKSVFNAQIQGSVAHAMQKTIYEVFKAHPNNILAEIHDSLIMVCRKEFIGDIVRSVSKIMFHPLSGILKENPKFPLKVSVGFEWKKWKPYKTCR